MINKIQNIRLQRLLDKRSSIIADFYTNTTSKQFNKIIKTHNKIDLLMKKIELRESIDPREYNEEPF